MSKLVREGKSRILNIYVSNTTFHLAVSSVLKKAIDQENGFFCFANAHMAVESLTNEELEKGLEHAELVLSDGFPIGKSMKLIYNINQERIAGMDFLPTVLKESNKHALSVFLFGSTEIVLEGAISRISEEYPKLSIAGFISPPFDQELVDEDYIKSINNSNPNMVLVALGCPKQEIWMSKNYHRISAPLLGIGGALIVYAGVLKRAPKFVQNAGFEWLYRLMQEPGRLWKRYLYTNTVFIIQIFKQWFYIKVLGKDSG